MTLLCEKEGEEQGRKWSFCNGKWLKVLWILTFLFSVCPTQSVIKERKVLHIKFIYCFVILMYQFLYIYKVKILSTLCFCFRVKMHFPTRWQLPVEGNNEVNMRFEVCKDGNIAQMVGRSHKRSIGNANHKHQLQKVYKCYKWQATNIRSLQAVGGLFSSL